MDVLTVNNQAVHGIARLIPGPRKVGRSFNGTPRAGQRGLYRVIIHLRSNSSALINAFRAGGAALIGNLALANGRLITVQLDSMSPDGTRVEGTVVPKPSQPISFRE
jgi:hypothetical protein